MTLCYAVFEPQNGFVNIASAGHWPPYHYAAKTQAVGDVYPSTAIAPALGTFPTEVYPDYQIALAPGDILAFYSDGIPEAANPAEEMYGEERFRDALRRHADRTAPQIRAAIMDEVNRFRGDAPQDDDIALVIVKKI
jgi:sigma-B regulation protein RsbU (phosphoserine phosphatase)